MRSAALQRYARFPGYRCPRAIILVYVTIIRIVIFSLLLSHGPVESFQNENVASVILTF